jgi:PhnB protein
VSGSTKADRRRFGTSIQPELWIDRAGAAIAFYEEAFGARVLPAWASGMTSSPNCASATPRSGWLPRVSVMQRFSPRQINGTTSRTLLVIDDPKEVVARAVAAGATESSPVGDEHGWRRGRIIDPFGHEWEVGKPLGPRPPT